MCIVFTPIHKRDLEKASCIFRGRIQTYEFLDASTPTDRRLVNLTFEMTEIIKGSLSGKTIDIYWAQGTNTRPPSSMEDFIKDFGDESIVGILKPEFTLHSAFSGSIFAFNIEKAKIGFPHAPDPIEAYWVLQPVCSNAFIYSVDSDELRSEKLQSVLEKGS